ncbi:hypothetical protein ACHHYP_20636 [Achlya hypogyna]|uniref:Uncharacterized protein n=1 Tax=Achlya hypogyna TaxID=1202772 RepID=A0A1V9YGH6_ACHHY|nr:hypothetical protein ACHHYP_20636 [Achlya hypogyna]
MSKCDPAPTLTGATATQTAFSSWSPSSPRTKLPVPHDVGSYDGIKLGFMQALEIHSVYT